MDEFRIDIAQTDLDDLHRRLVDTRWPTPPRVDDWSRGVPTDHLRQLADYWATGFDWRAQEAALNEIPQFRTEIDGQAVHFFHARSPRPDALPIVLTHGWPSSPVEFLRLIGPLTDAGFHLVMPSLPGYGYSDPIPAGFNLFAVARTWATLMDRLGYHRYVAHGTDVGSGVAGMLPMVDPGRVAGVHLTGTAAGTPFDPPIEPAGLDPADRARAERFNRFLDDGTGYLAIQQTRPQTLAYALTDSPVGQLAWIVEKFREWTDPAAGLPEQAVDRDQLLTNVSLYWFTGSGASSAHAVYDGMRAWREFAARPADGPGYPAEAPAGPPTGVAVFAADTTIRSRMDPAGTIRHWTEYDRGGHFPAMEVPDLLAADLIDFCAPLR
ncbi:MAG TPA: alpha/beta fold hydrolase [Actinoplanes sp.]|nr:alpha/beta fold hydrolase [Actinoplanes sp.]